MVYNQLYDKDIPQQQDFPDSTNNKITVKKNKQQLLECIKVLTKKGFVDKLQEYLEKYNSKIKILEDIKEKINNLGLPVSCGQGRLNPNMTISSPNLTKICAIISCTSQLLQHLSSISQEYPQFTSCYTLPTVSTYYQTIKQAIKQKLIIINLNDHKCNFNIGMFVLFILRQWGQRIDRMLYLIMGFGLILIVELGLTQSDTTDLNKKFMKILQQFIQTLLSNKFISTTYPQQQNIQFANKFLNKLYNAFSHSSQSFSIQTIQSQITQALIDYMDNQSINECIYTHNNVATVSPPFIKQNGEQIKTNKLDSYCIHMSTFNNNLSINYKWLFKNIVILTGDLSTIQPSQQEKLNGLRISSTQEHLYETCLKSIQKLLNYQTANIIQLKSIEILQNQLKKMLHQKFNVLIPIIEIPYTSSYIEFEQIKYKTILQMLIKQLIKKHNNITTHKNTITKQRNSIITLNNPNLYKKLQKQQNQKKSNNHNKINQDFKIYIYCNNIKQIGTILSKLLKIDKSIILQSIFIRNITNCMIFNCNISKYCKGKLDYKQILQQKQLNKSKSISTVGNNNTTNNRTKKQIPFGNQQKDLGKSKLQNATFPIPSMRTLQLQTKISQHGSCNTPPLIQSQFNYTQTINPIRTNKFIHNLLGSHNDIPSPPIAKYLYKAANIIIKHIQYLLRVLTLKNDYGKNFYNDWFFSISYFNGIDKILQIIANQNQNWNLGRSVTVLCQIMQHLINNSSSFYLKQHFNKFLKTIINKIQSNNKTNRLSIKNLQQNQLEMQKIIIEINKIVQQNLIEIKDYVQQIKGLNQIKLNILQKQAEFIYFKYSWLNLLGKFANVQINPLKYQQGKLDQKLNKPTKYFTHHHNQHHEQASNKVRISGRKSKNLQPELPNHLKNKIYPHIAYKKEQKLIGKLQDCEQQLVLNKYFNNYSNYWLDKDLKANKICQNIVKNQIDSYKRAQISHIRFLSKQKSLHYISNTIHNFLLFYKNGIIPSGLTSYINSQLNIQDTLKTHNTIKSISKIKDIRQQQVSKISRDFNHSIDLTPFKNPIAFIKAYLHNQLCERVLKNDYQYVDCGRNTQNQLNQHKKLENSIYYCIAYSLTEQQKNQNYIKLKSIAATGWRLSSESTFETTSQDKVTHLNNVYICKRVKPQQMNACQILLCSSEQDKQQSITLYAFTKKNLGLKFAIKLAYIKQQKII